MNCFHFLWPGWLLVSSCHNDDSVLSYPHPRLYTHLPHLALSIRCGQKGEEKPAWSSGLWVIHGILHKWVKGRRQIFPEANIPVSKFPVTYCPTRIKKKKMQLLLWPYFRLWCWRRLLILPWAARRLNQYILKEINPEYSLEGLRTDAEAEAPILWPPDAGKDWGQEGKGAAEDEMLGWHYWPSEREFEEAPGDREGQGSLVCCSPWDRKE